MEIVIDGTTALVYLIAGVICGLVSVQSKIIFPSKTKFHRVLWFAMAVGMVFFGINEVLDLQNQFTNTIKSIAMVQGWYAWGQQAQIIFIYSLAISALLVVTIIFWLVRENWHQYWLLLFGILIIVRFVIVRAATFYGVSIISFSQFSGGIRMNWLLELLGAAIIVLGASLNLAGLGRSKYREKLEDHTFAEE
jgi:hypothetical protein